MVYYPCRVTPQMARSAVLTFASKHKLNRSALARELSAQYGLKVGPNNVEQWLKEVHEPRDPKIWIQIADVLGLQDAPDEESATRSIVAAANRLALLVMDLDDASIELRAAAADVLKAVSKKYFS